jgi:hypothetical protein
VKVTPPDLFEGHIRKLVGALKRLEDGQGRVARRNARNTVKRALQAVQTAMDTAYPHIRKEVKERRVLPPGQRFRKLLRKGWVTHSESRHPDLATLNRAKIRIKEVAGCVLIPEWIEHAITKETSITSACSPASIDVSCSARHKFLQTSCLQTTILTYKYRHSKPCSH